MRDPLSYKGENGKILVLAGSGAYPGAAYLCSMAALRCGVDLVHVMTPRVVATSIHALSPELIVLPFEEEYFNESHVELALSHANFADVVLIGPGLGEKEETLNAIRKFLLKNEKPLVIDADALKAITPPLSFNAILTPHRKELTYLTGEFEESAISTLLSRYASKDTVILLKGPIDLISNGVKIHENHSGTSSMTKGGSGDVLAGICAGLLALSGDKFKSAKDAAYYAGKIGEKLSKEKGHGWLTSEMLDQIPYALMHANGNHYTSW